MCILFDEDGRGKNRDKKKKITAIEKKQIEEAKIREQRNDTAHKALDIYQRNKKKRDQLKAMKKAKEAPQPQVQTHSGQDVNMPIESKSDGEIVFFDEDKQQQPQDVSMEAEEVKDKDNLAEVDDKEPERNEPKLNLNLNIGKIQVKKPEKRREFHITDSNNEEISEGPKSHKSAEVKLVLSDDHSHQTQPPKPRSRLEAELMSQERTVEIKDLINVLQDMGLQSSVHYCRASSLQ